MLQSKVYGSQKENVNIGRRMGHSNDGAMKKLGHTNGGIKRLGHTNGMSMNGRSNINTELYPRF